VCDVKIGDGMPRLNEQQDKPGLMRPVVLHLAVAISLVWIVPGEAAAQSASFRSVDTNGDRVLDFDELVAAFGKAGALKILSTTDHNRDGRVTIFELRSDPGGGQSASDSGGDVDEDGDDNGDDDGDDEDDDGDDDGDDGGDDRDDDD
jgi:hypothetical protein